MSESPKLLINDNQDSLNIGHDFPGLTKVTSPVLPMINENQTSKWRRKKYKKNWKIHFLQVLPWVMSDESNNNNVRIVYLFSSVLTGIFDRRVKTMCVFHFDALWFSFVRTIGPARTTDSQLSTASVRKSSFSVIHRFIDCFQCLCCHETQSEINIKSIEKSNRKEWGNIQPLHSELNWISRQFKCLDFMNDDDRCVKCLL